MPDLHPCRLLAIKAEMPVRRCMTSNCANSDSASQSGKSEQSSTGRARILVVEDNCFVAMTIENALTDAGYEVLAIVESGEEALATGSTLTLGARV